MKYERTMKNYEATKQRLDDFFTTYYDAKVARDVKRRPESAIPILSKDMKAGLSSSGTLSAYMSAMDDAVELYGLGTNKT